MAHPISILHLSDLHFGAHDPDKVASVLDFARENKPDLACITGDIVDLPLKRNFVAARGFYDTLAPLCSNNVFVIPGNHDAFLRSFSLKSYRRNFQPQTEFSESRNIKGRDVFVVGINTTTFSLAHLNNSGIFGKKSQAFLINAIRDEKVRIGNGAFRSSIKVFLVHHHPLPTASGRLEEMLYFKNAGEFLTIAASEGVNLILHGHQHDPFYYSLDCNVGGDEQPMTILSAGTATKELDGDEGLSRVCQIHLIKILDGGTNIECHNYHYDIRQFLMSRIIKKRSRGPKISHRTEYLKYVIEQNTDMKVIGKRYIAARVGHTLGEFHLIFGSDPRSPPCDDFSKLGFNLERDGQRIDSSHIQVTTDDPRRKVVAVKLEPEIDVSGSTFKWEYVWPQGFSNLFSAGRDLGFFTMQDPIESLKVEVELNHPNRDIQQFQVIYSDMEKITLLHEDNPKLRGFEANQPIRTHALWFNVWI